MRHAADLGKKLVGEDRDVRLFQPGSGEDVDDLLGNQRLRDDLAYRVVEQLGRLAVVRNAFDELCTHCLEEADLVTDAKRSVVRHR